MSLVLGGACKEPPGERPAPEVDIRTPAPPPGIEPVRAHLAGLVSALDDAVGTCKDACCFDGLVQWKALDRSSLVQLTEAKLRAVLRWLVEHPESPRERALAVRWLAGLGHAEDVGVLENVLDDEREAWRAPSSGSLQPVQRCTPATRWEPVSVQRVALGGLARATGHAAATVEEYRRWRASFPDVRDSLQYWDARVPLTESSGCLEAILPMMQHDRGLGLRLALARADRPWGDGRPCPSPEGIRGTRKAHGEPSLLALVLEPSAWSASVDATYRPLTDWPALARWVLGRAARTLAADDAYALDQVAALPEVAKDPALGSLVAAARVQLDPEHHVALIDDALDEIVDPPPELLTTLASLRPESLGRSRWLAKVATCHEAHLAYAVLEGLAKAGASGRAALAGHVTDPAMDLEHRPEHARALGMLAMSLGGPESLDDCTELRELLCDAPTAEERAELEAKNARHLSSCVRKLTKFFAP